MIGGNNVFKFSYECKLGDASGTCIIVIPGLFDRCVTTIVIIELIEYQNTFMNTSVWTHSIVEVIL